MTAYITVLNCMSCVVYSKYSKVKREFIQRISFKKTSNALVTLVETKKDCLEKLFKTVKTTRWISQATNSRPSDRQSKTPDGRMC